MFLVSLLRHIAFSYYDYKAYNFNIEKTDFVVIHIPDQIGDAMESGQQRAASSPTYVPRKVAPPNTNPAEPSPEHDPDQAGLHRRLDEDAG